MAITNNTTKLKLLFGTETALKGKSSFVEGSLYFCEGSNRIYLAKGTTEADLVEFYNDAIVNIKIGTESGKEKMVYFTPAGGGSDIVLDLTKFATTYEVLAKIQTLNAEAYAQATLTSTAASETSNGSATLTVKGIKETNGVISASDATDNLDLAVTFAGGDNITIKTEGNTVTISGGESGVTELTAGTGISFGDDNKITSIGTISAKVKEGNGLSVDATDGIKMAVGTTSAAGAVSVTEGNGLSISTTGVISMSAASTDVAGAMSATDKTKLDGIEEGAEANIIESVKLNGTPLVVDSNKAVDVTAVESLGGESGVITLKAASETRGDVTLAVSTGGELSATLNATDQASLGKADSSVQGVTIDGVDVVDSTDNKAKIVTAGNDAYHPETNKLVTESDIKGITGVMHFVGVATSPAAAYKEGETPKSGDIVVIGAGATGDYKAGQEYVYDGSKWQLLGDENAGVLGITDGTTEVKGTISLVDSDSIDFTTSDSSTPSITADVKVDADGYVKITENKGLDIKTQAVSTATADNNAVALAKDVRDYVDAETTRAQGVEGTLTSLTTTEKTTLVAAINEVNGKASTAVQGVQINGAVVELEDGNIANIVFDEVAAAGSNAIAQDGLSISFKDVKQGADGQIAEGDVTTTLKFHSAYVESGEGENLIATMADIKASELSAGDGIDITNGVVSVDLTENGGLTLVGETENKKTLSVSVDGKTVFIGTDGKLTAKSKGKSNDSTPVYTTEQTDGAIPFDTANTNITVNATDGVTMTWGTF